MTKINTKDWRNLPIENWNTLTFSTFITDNTFERYGVTYAPGGGGSLSQRWSREKGVLKHAQSKHGNVVLKRFFEICWREYKPTQQYPYITVMFALSYLDRHFINAEIEINRDAKRKQAAVENETNNEELKEWF